MSIITYKKPTKMLWVLCIIIMLLPNLTSAEGFDITYSDPEGDVEDFESGIVQGYEEIDILEISSLESTLSAYLTLEMTVKGVITDSDYIVYGFELMDTEEAIYSIYYCNGICSGTNYDDGSSDVLQASGSGTSTLEVRVQINDIGEVSDFDIMGMSSEYDEENELYPSDWVPDFDWDFDDWYSGLPVMITDPKPGATVSGTRTIGGITDPWSEMSYIEIQLDATSEGGWMQTSSSDNWTTWEYQWDTTEFDDGLHTINARGYDGEEYYFDSIDVYVNQSNALSPRTTDVPPLKIGMELKYSVNLAGLAEMDYFGEDFEMSAEMTMKVVNKKTIEVKGTEYETYVVDTTTSISQTITFEGDTMSMTSTSEGTQWLRVSDLATVKTYMETSSSGMGFSDTSSMESTYDPPVDSYNFPMSIAETWMITYTETIRETYSYNGEPETYTDSYEATMECEALHVEEVTVPAGTFETFVIFSQEKSGEYYGGGGIFTGMGEGYSLNYYSSDIGFPVKSEYYYDNRELDVSMELTSYSETGFGPDRSSPSQGWEIPIYFLLIPIIIAIILASVVAVRRRKKRASAEESWNQYASGAEVSPSPSQMTGTVPFISSAQPHHGQVQPFPSSPPPPLIPPLTIQQQGISTTQISKMPPPPPPPLKPYEVSSKPAPSTVSSRKIIPSMRIKCPRCSHLFFVQKGSASVRCPQCGTYGKMQQPVS